MAALEWGKASDPARALSSVPSSQNPWGMQLALHLAQRTNKLPAFLEFGLCLGIPPWLVCNTFFLPVNFVFPMVFQQFVVLVWFFSGGK